MYPAYDIFTREETAELVSKQPRDLLETTTIPAVLFDVQDSLVSSLRALRSLCCGYAPNPHARIGCRFIGRGCFIGHTGCAQNGVSCAHERATRCLLYTSPSPRDRSLS
eukprot:596430-Pyramimonas_sp.AAC.2